MANEEKCPIMMRGDRFLLAIDALRGLFEPVPGIDHERTRNAITRLLGLNPDYVLSGIVNAACQLDHDGMLRKVLRSCGPGPGGPGLWCVEFDARALLDDVKEGGYRHANEQLEQFFLAVAHGDLTEVDFRPEGGA